MRSLQRLPTSEGFAIEGAGRRLPLQVVRGPGRAEFVGLASSMMAMFALSIDLVLPALRLLATELGASRPNDQQYVVTFVILGMSIGQVFYGPLSDRLGRKATILIGLALFGAGCLLAITATRFEALLLGRLLQGLGAAGPRIVTLALVRDQYSGRDMARIMSIIVAVLMIGPLLAPFAGQGLLWIASWRLGFVVLLLLDLLIVAWLVVRQPETLPRERRLLVSWPALGTAVREVCTSRTPLACTLAAGLAFAQLFSYIGSAPQIFQGLYGAGAWFPVCLASSGLSIAAASLMNARLVGRLGMRRLCRRASQAEALLSSAFLVFAWTSAGLPPLWALLLFVSAAFFCVGVLFGNLNAWAMEPLGHIAGTAAGVVGSLTWGVAVCLATLVGRFFDGTVLPLVSGLAASSLASVVLLRWVARGDE